MPFPDGDYNVFYAACLGSSSKITFCQTRWKCQTYAPSIATCYTSLVSGFGSYQVHCPPAFVPPTEIKVPEKPLYFTINIEFLQYKLVPTFAIGIQKRVTENLLAARFPGRFVEVFCQLSCQPIPTSKAELICLPDDSKE